MEPGMVSTRSIVLECIVLNRRGRGWEEKCKDEWLCSSPTLPPYTIYLISKLNPRSIWIFFKWSITEA